ncbi:MAG: DUF374 domain-containing protein [Polyangiaceae bacterium]|nr:DUF374 domain-containing protein [Polyangiaceae bacterium]
MRFCIGFAVGLLVRLWGWTWRVRVHAPAALGVEPMVLAFWHGTQLALTRARPPRTTALVSWSRDGAVSHGAMRALGLGVVRGSSSRGGASGLRAIIRRLRAGGSAVFAVDGPRGPLHRAKPGAAQAARLGKARLVPVGAWASRRWLLSRAWDHFQLPLPFARIVVVAGPALDPARALAQPELLEQAIHAANDEAERRAMLPALPEASCPQ